MDAFSDLKKLSFNTQREHWEKGLKSELRVEDLKGRTYKKNLDVDEWPILLLNAEPVHISNNSPWKKAAQTYLSYGPELKDFLREDLSSGVRCFFFTRRDLTVQLEKTISTELGSFSGPEDIEVYFLEDIICGRETHETGGNAIQELGLTLTKLIDGLNEGPMTVGVFMDSRIFTNIAKIRALRLMITKVQEESGHRWPVKIVALSSYRDWTLFERYSNVLRNVSQVASGLIGGADAVQSSGYQSLFEIESNFEIDHAERSRRLARNTSHVLALESMLGTVEDAAHGSYHLEALTEEFARKSWEFMQKCLGLGVEGRKEFITTEVDAVREVRVNSLRTRRYIMAGTNDYAEAGEKLGIFPKQHFFRTARDFEELRLEVERLNDLPEVEIVLGGDYSVLSSRINFIKNYFELIGLKVHDPLQKKAIKSTRTLKVLCAKDADYPELASSNPDAMFVAGKVEIKGLTSIYSGQDIYQVLSQLVEGWKT